MPGVTLAGTFELALNTTGSPVSQTFSAGAFPIVLDLPAGNFLRVAGSGVTLRAGGASLTGNFSFERVTLDGSPVVSVSFSNVELGLGDGTTDFVRATDGAGSFVLGSGGLYGTFRADVAVDVPGVSFNGNLHVEIDTTTIVQTPDDIPAGLRIVGAATLVIAGQELGANFLIQRNAAGMVTIAVTDLNFRLTIGGTPLVEVRNLAGVLIVGPAGVAASFETATIPTFALPGIRVESDPDATQTLFKLQINTGSAAVSESIDVDGDSNTAPVDIDVPAGPFVRVVAAGVQLCFTTGSSCGASDPTLKGDFFFDQITRNGFGASIPLPDDLVERDERDGDRRRRR